MKPETPNVPRVVASASERKSRKSDGPPRARGARRAPLEGVPTLIVEDDAASRKLLAIILTDAGVQVTAVASAEEALVVLATWTPRLIVVDLVLPRMGGLRFVEELRREQRYGPVTVVALTSLVGPDAERAARDAGCDAYFTKPIDAGEFVAATARVLRG